LIKQPEPNDSTVPTTSWAPKDPSFRKKAAHVTGTESAEGWGWSSVKRAGQISREQKARDPQGFFDF